jgi:hypothetical protein
MVEGLDTILAELFRLGGLLAADRVNRKSKSNDNDKSRSPAGIKKKNNSNDNYKCNGKSKGGIQGSLDYGLAMKLRGFAPDDGGGDGIVGWVLGCDLHVAHANIGAFGFGVGGVEVLLDGGFEDAFGGEDEVDGVAAGALTAG